MPLTFRSYVENGLSMCLSDPVIKSVLGDEIDYGALFAYLFRRFGYPHRGWDDYKQLVSYYLTTPHPDMLMEITPYVGGTSAISIRFLVSDETLTAVNNYGQRHRTAWDARSLDWAEAQGLPDWMPEWVQIYNTDYREAFPHLPLATDWRQTVGFYYALGEIGSPEYELTNRIVEFREKVREGYEAVEPFPPHYDRPQDLSLCNDDDPLKPLVPAATEALKDLLTPVGVRDLAINALGRVESRRANAKRAVSAGYPSGALGNTAPEEFVKLHELVLKLGKGNAKRGINKVLAAFQD